MYSRRVPEGTVQKALSVRLRARRERLSNVRVFRSVQRTNTCHITGTACVVCTAGSNKRCGFRLFVYLSPVSHSAAAAAAGLLLWAPPTGDIDRLLEKRRARANAGSATLSGYVGG